MFFGSRLFFLFLDRIQGIQRAANDISKETLKILRNRIHGSKGHTKELFLAREFGKGLDPGFVEILPFQATEFDRKFFVFLCEFDQYLCCSHRIIIPERDSTVFLELVLQDVMRTVSNSQTGQGVLDHLVVAAAFTELNPQGGQFLDLDSLEIGNHGNAGLARLLLQTLYDSCLICPIHLATSLLRLGRMSQSSLCRKLRVSPPAFSDSSP